MLHFRFHRVVRLFPGVHLHLTARRPSLSFGVRGMSVNYGMRRVPRVSLGLPGTGMSWRSR